MPRANDIMTPIHPGEVLREEFLEAMGISQYRLAKDLGVSPMRVSQIVRGERAVTADTAMRLARYFGNSVDFWLGLQMQYEIETAEDESGDRIDQEVTPLSKAGV